MDEIGVVDSLDESECVRRLATQQLGRLVTHIGNVLDVFPVNYVVTGGGDIVFRTAEGSKLFELTVNDEVLFEVDDHTDAGAWSVIVRGHARRLETEAEIEAAEQLGLHPWVPTLKRNYVRVTAAEITGRAFGFAPEPDRSGVHVF